MLPQIFRPGDPVLDVSLPPETRSQLEDLLKALPGEIFQADDSLGWVYQFWQAERKEEINLSETKIGADELPAVTQLFTEDYMVLFLLHNTLGAWWAGKVLAARTELAQQAQSEDDLRAACAVGDVTWAYLRFVRDPSLPSPSGRGAGGEGAWRPAAGTFDGWPKHAREITLLDPCMGSGHFLVFALPILVAFHMVEDGLSREAAVDAVLRDNLFGLEIDPRCTQIAAFKLALAAWRIAGHRALPPLQLACSGLALGVTKEEWLKLAERISPLPPDKSLFDTKHNLFSQEVQGGLEAIYDLFEKAPWLGSLIDPRLAGSTLLEAGYKQIEPLLAPLLASQAPAELSEMAVTAQGLAKAAELLARHYTLVLTNVPYLGRGKQEEVLKGYLDTQYPLGKADVATAFVLRCLEFCTNGGSTGLVTPVNWLFLTTYSSLRETLLNRREWNMVARLGAGAFETIGGHVVNVALLEISAKSPTEKSRMSGMDVSSATQPEEKSAQLRVLSNISTTFQAPQLTNPDARIIKEIAFTRSDQLSKYAIVAQGISTTDAPQFVFNFWELPSVSDGWEYFQTASRGGYFEGCSLALCWAAADERYIKHIERLKSENRIGGAWQAGRTVWGKEGFTVNVTSTKHVGWYSGKKFDVTVGVIVPNRPEYLPAVQAYLVSSEYINALRALDPSLSVTEGSLLKVPFDLGHWQRVAAKKHPSGLPEPESDDPTQWLFHGRPEHADAPLQVAVSRLLGYRWPAEFDSEMRLSPRAWELVARCNELASHSDADGIVCLSSIKGNRPPRHVSTRCWPRHSVSTGQPVNLTPSWPAMEFMVAHSTTGCATGTSRTTATCSTSGRSSGTSGTGGKMAFTHL